MRHWPGGLDPRRVLVAAGIWLAASRRGTQRLAGLRGGAAAAGRNGTGVPAAGPDVLQRPAPALRQSCGAKRIAIYLPLPSQLARGPRALWLWASPAGPGRPGFGAEGARYRERGSGAPVTRASRPRPR
jgi:hypothetical protein